jgi:hypothetical protein
VRASWEEGRKVKDGEEESTEWFGGIELELNVMGCILLEGLSITDVCPSRCKHTDFYMKTSVGGKLKTWQRAFTVHR